MLLQFIRTKTPFSWIFKFSLVFSRTLFIPLLLFELSKATNLFEILIRYYFITSISFSLLRLNHSKPIFRAASLFTASLSLTFATTRQWSVSQSVLLKDRTSSILECHILSINMWSIWLWVFPSGETQVYLWMLRCGKIVLLTTRFLMWQRLLF
jgi:hypothetical protein